MAAPNGVSGKDRIRQMIWMVLSSGAAKEATSSKTKITPPSQVRYFWSIILVRIYQIKSPTEAQSSIRVSNTSISVSLDV